VLAALAEKAEAAMNADSPVRLRSLPGEAN